MAVHDEERAAMFDGVARPRRQIGRMNIELDLRHASAGRCGGGAEIGIGVFQCLLRHSAHSLKRMDWPSNARSGFVSLVWRRRLRDKLRAEVATKSPGSQGSPPIRRFAEHAQVGLSVLMANGKPDHKVLSIVNAPCTCGPPSATRTASAMFRGATSEGTPQNRNGRSARDETPGDRKYGAYFRREI